MIPKKLFRKVTKQCIISGIIAITLSDAIFLFVFPSAWVFFITPAFMGWWLTKFCKFPNEALNDESVFNQLSKRVGILCATMCFGAILISLLPLVVLSSSDIIIYLLCNFLFYLVCGLCIFTGYNRGVAIVTDAYYDILN